MRGYQVNFEHMWSENFQNLKKSVWTRIRVLSCVWGGAGEFPAPRNARGIIWNARAKFLNFQTRISLFRLPGPTRDLPRTYLVGPADPLDNSDTGARRRAPTPTDPSAIARYDVFGELAYFFGIRADVLGFVRIYPGPTSDLPGRSRGPTWQFWHRRAQESPIPTDPSDIARYDVFVELAYFLGSVPTFLDFSLKVIHMSAS